MRISSLLAAFTALSFCHATQAQMTLVDTNQSNCKIYHPSSVLTDRKYEWQGACENGFAHGLGVRKYTFTDSNSQRTSISEGRGVYDQGKMTGDWSFKRVGEARSPQDWVTWSFLAADNEVSGARKWLRADGTSTKQRLSIWPPVLETHLLPLHRLQQVVL
jgi:hypothetical protein